MSLWPTVKQVRIIKSKFKLPVPSTLTECTKLITYILEGEDKASTVYRIRFVRKLFNLWLKAMVARPHGFEVGIVDSLRMRSLAEIKEIKERVPWKITPYPLTASVDFPNRHGTIDIPLSRLRIVNPPGQKLLFPLAGDMEETQQVPSQP